MNPNEQRPLKATTKKFGVVRIGTGLEIDTDGSLKATVGGGGVVSSVFGRTGTVTAQSGDYTASQITNFDEAAQDAVGNAIGQGLEYDDPLGALSAKTQMSITKDASGLMLSGDESSPGNSQYYGTDGSGTKGFHSLPAGGSGSSIETEVDFGFASGGQGDTATTTVAASWVAAGTKLVASVMAETTTDHDPEDAVVEGVQAYILNINAGVGFDVMAYAPQGTWGRYSIHVVAA